MLLQPIQQCSSFHSCPSNPLSTPHAKSSLLKMLGLCHYSLAYNPSITPLHTGNSSQTWGPQSPAWSGPNCALSPHPSCALTELPVFCSLNMSSLFLPSGLGTCPILPLVILNGWFFTIQNSGLSPLSNLMWFPSHSTFYHSILILYVRENHYLFPCLFTVSSYTRMWAPQKEVVRFAHCHIPGS